MKKTLLLLLLGSGLGLQSDGAVIAGNWCNTANIYDGPAGLLDSQVWSNLTAPAPPVGNNFYAIDSASGLGGSEAARDKDVLVFSDGTPAPAALTVSWHGADLDTNDEVTRPMWPNTIGADIDDGHDQLMTGHLKITDPDGTGPIPPGILTLGLAGMSDVLAETGGVSYELYLYVDGDEEATGKPADWVMTDGTLTYYGRDDATFADVHTIPGSLDDFIQVTSTSGVHQSGNYVRWSGLTADTFSIALTTVNGTDIGVAGFEINILVPPTDAPGTGTIGYWKNHPDAWPSDQIVVGGLVYTRDQAISLMKTPGKGDKTHNLFNQLVAAKLNVAVGNDSSCVDDALRLADEWLVDYPVGSGVKAKNAAWKKDGGILHEILDDYNNGLLCAPHRDD